MCYSNKIFFILIFLNISIAQAEDFGFGIEGHYLKRSPLVDQMNASAQKTTFLTSSLGFGYQSEIEPNKTVISNLKKLKKGQNSVYVECQAPLGKPIQCVKECIRSKISPYPFTTCGKGETNFSVDYSNLNLSATPENDFLNEGNTKDKELKYIFLDTIINNTDYSFWVILTDIPLLDTYYDEEALVNYQSDTDLIGLINKGTINLGEVFKSALSTIGEEQKLLTDKYVKMIENPSLKGVPFEISKKDIRKHMANQNLAISNSPDALKKHQTIMLFPKVDCQPIILIGKDKIRNICSAAIVKKNCTEKKDKDIISVIETFSSPEIVQYKEPARIKIVIGLTNQIFKDQCVWAKINQIDILNELWWPEKNLQGDMAKEFKIDEASSCVKIEPEK